MATKPEPAEPRFVTVQHILIGFQGSPTATPAQRSKEDAEQLAQELVARANSEQVEFRELVSTYTDDKFPGVYQLANTFVKSHEIPLGYTPRKSVYLGFGKVSFSLEVGEVGLVEFDSATSPAGWHIIKRLE